MFAGIWTGRDCIWWDVSSRLALSTKAAVGGSEGLIRLSHDLWVFFNTRISKEVNYSDWTCLGELDMYIIGLPWYAHSFVTKPHQHNLVMTWLFKPLGSGRCTFEGPPNTRLVMVAFNRFWLAWIFVACSLWFFPCPTGPHVCVCVCVCLLSLLSHDEPADCRPQDAIWHPDDGPTIWWVGMGVCLRKKLQYRCLEKVRVLLVVLVVPFCAIWCGCCGQWLVWVLWPRSWLLIGFWFLRAFLPVAVSGMAPSKAHMPLLGHVMSEAESKHPSTKHATKRLAQSQAACQKVQKDYLECWMLLRLLVLTIDYWYS